MWLPLLTVFLLALPDQVPLKTPTETFTATHDIALRDGVLWWRPLGAAWSLLPPDGLPLARGKHEALQQLLPGAFQRPARVEQLSADGDNLIATSPEGTVYYVKLSTLEWVDQWGPTGMQAPLSVKGLTAFAMSHRMIAYEDLDGNVHPVSAGVTTLYGLREQGRTLGYADPWLPANFERTVCLPDRGRFIASALSASASTLFVMDAAGRSFTRLIDFDIQGDNPALPYSYERAKRSGLHARVRTLPAPEWTAQPLIPGKHTTRITILQTGTTNADRELRVEGDGGLWTKRLDDATWTFTPRALTHSGLPFVTPGAPPLGPPGDLELTAKDPWPKTRLTLSRWNALCPPALLHVEAGAEVLDLELPFHFGLALGTDDDRSLHGALLLPKGKTPWLRKLRVLARGKDHLDVELTVTKDEVRLRKLPLLDLHFARR